jgi:hypothetical protein
VELGADATYLVKGLGSISFHIPYGGVLELNEVLFVPSLKKKYSFSFLYGRAPM